MIEIRGPDGSINRFPDGTADDVITKAMSAQYGGPSMGAMAGDVAASAGIGAVKGTLGLADIPNLIESGLNWGNEKLVEKGLAQPRDRTAVLPMSSSAALQKNIEGAIGTEFYKPKTYAGEWAETVGEFAPAAIGGPGSLATRLATRAAAPAVASEGAGHLTQGTKAELPSRVAAALLAGPAATRIAGQAGLVPRTVPTAEQLKTAGSEVYSNPAVTGRPVQQGALTNTADDITAAMTKGGARERNMPGLFGDVDELKALGPNATVADVRSVREVLGNTAFDNIGTSTSKHARDAIKRVDETLEGVAPELKVANANYSAGKRSDLIDEKLTRAELRSGATASGQNVSNATRQRMVDILLNKKEGAGFSPAELAQVERVAMGTRTGNAARDVANVLGGGGGLGNLAAAGGLGTAGGYYGGKEGAGAGVLAGLLLGRGAKAVEKASTARQMKILDEMVRSRAPFAAGMPSVRDPENIALIRALLGTSAANQGTR